MPAGLRIDSAEVRALSMSPCRRCFWMMVSADFSLAPEVPKTERKRLGALWALRSLRQLRGSRV